MYLLRGMQVIFCLPTTTHNYIISTLDYNIMERLDRSLFIIVCIRIIILFSK